MGTVFRAHDGRLGRKVAIKVLRHGTTGQERLRREARALAQLSHPNVVPVFEVGEDGGHAYVVMEHVAGQTLRQWLDGEQRTLQDILEMFAQAGEGLASAHAAGIVHRDFKPENILVGRDGRVRVVDFGIAAWFYGKASEQLDSAGIEPQTVSRHDPATPRRAGLSQVGACIGTIPYMAPEQILGETIGPWTDQFAFFATLHEAIYGELPWQLDSLDREVASVPVRARGERVPAGLRRAMARGLASSQHERFATMHTALLALHVTSRTTPWLAVAVAAAGIASLGMYAAATDSCDTSASLWDEQRRATLSSHLRSRDPEGHQRHQTRIESSLDDYAERWRDTYRQVCEDPVLEHDAMVRDAKMLCLDARKSDFLAHVRVLSQMQELTASAALEVVVGLPDPSSCVTEAAVTTDWSASAQPPEHLADAVASLRERLNEIEAAQQMGAVEEARAAADELLDDAQALGFVPLVNEVRLAVALLLRQQQPEAASARLKEIFLDAKAQRQHALAFTAAIELERLSTYRFRDFQAARRWGQFAQSEYLAGDGDARALAELLVADGYLSHTLDRFPEAAERYQAALHVLVPVFEGSHMTVLRIQAELVRAMLMSGQAQDAVALGQAVLADHERVLGPEHPSTLGALATVAAAQFMGGDYAAAEASYHRKIALEVELFGDDHLETMSSLSNLAAALMNQGKLEEAELALQRAIALAPRDAQGRVLRHAVDARLNLGQLWLRQERLDEAESMLIRVLEAASDPDMRRRRLHALMGLGEIAASRQNWDEAERRYEEAWAETVAAHQEHTPVANYLLLGWASVRAADGRWREALALAQRAVAMTEGRDDLRHYRSSSLKGRGQILAQLGDFEGALADLELLRASTDPGAEAAHVQLAAVLVPLMYETQPAKAQALAVRVLDEVSDEDLPHAAELREWLRLARR